MMGFLLIQDRWWKGPEALSTGVICSFLVPFTECAHNIDMLRNCDVIHVLHRLVNNARSFLVHEISIYHESLSEPLKVKKNVRPFKKKAHLREHLGIVSQNKLLVYEYLLFYPSFYHSQFLIFSEWSTCSAPLEQRFGPEIWSRNSRRQNFDLLC